MNRVLRAIMGSPDNRSPSEVDRDIEEEFAFHLEMAQRELMESGLSAERARERALAKFGSPERYRRECRTITLKERIVLQRITLVMLVVVFIMAGAALAMQLQAQRQTLAAIDQIKQRLDAPSPAASVSAYQPSVRISRSPGDDSSARNAPLTPGEKNTALRVLAREVFPLEDKLAITVMRPGERGDYQNAATMTVARLRADPTLDIELRDNDRVVVSDQCWYAIQGDVPNVPPVGFSEAARTKDERFTVRELLWRHQSPASTVASLTIERWNAGKHEQRVHEKLDASVLDALVLHGDRYTIKSKYPEGVEQAKAIMARTLRPEWDGRGPFSITIGCDRHGALYAFNLPGPVNLSEVIDLFRSRGVPESAMRTLAYMDADGRDGKLMLSVNSSQMTPIEVAQALDAKGPLVFKAHVYAQLLSQPPSELGKFGFRSAGEMPGKK
jgi:hypothetical protein